MLNTCRCAQDGKGKAFSTFKNAFDSKGNLKPALQEENHGMVSRAVSTMDGMEYAGATLATSATQGVDQAQFNLWCGQSGKGRLNVLPWLRRLGDQWVRTMGVPVQERTLAAMPPPPAPEAVSADVAMVDVDKEAELRELFGLAGPATVHPLARCSFVLTRRCVFSRHYSLDGGTHAPPIMDRRSFGRCMCRLGLRHPLLIERFFSVFDTVRTTLLEDACLLASAMGFVDTACEWVLTPLDCCAG
jgi:hypothetical protein